MINSAHNYPLSQIFAGEGIPIIYEIPKYQREYTWSKYHWETLFDDLLDNDVGYYLGSIICVNKTDDALQPKLELVDGQQRLLTLSLLLAASFNLLRSIEAELDDEMRAEIVYIKRKLVLQGSSEKVRLVPQIHNHNSEDFFAVLANAGLINERALPKYAKNRKIFRAYQYFLSRIEREISAENERIGALKGILQKFNSACMVKIEVSSHADAYTLFESLNNRGIPLNAIDLIKNKLLASFDNRHADKVDLYYKRWVDMLNVLGTDYTTQERFFRHYYNALKSDLEKICRVTIATRSNLIGIYEKLIDTKTTEHIDGIFEASRVYSYIISRAPDDQFDQLEHPLKSLERIQGSPSYLLLLHLLLNFQTLSLTTDHLASIIRKLVQFFVRRNLTDVPATRKLSKIFMTIVEEVKDMKNIAIVKHVEKKLCEESASDDEFKRRLLGDVYLDNAGATRFILCSLAECKMTRETHVDLWRREKNKFVWTVEHVLPQGDPLPVSWVEMIANGNAEEAREIQQNYTHKIGNLTISGYNSALSNKSFLEKRDRKDTLGRPVGYNNNFSLNQTLAVATKWNEELIDARTQLMVNEATQLYAMEDGSAIKKGTIC